MVPCRVKEEARKADKQLTLVPIIFLFLRSWSMIRFCIYLVSSAQQSQSLLDAQEILTFDFVRPFKILIKSIIIFLLVN